MQMNNKRPSWLKVRSRQSIDYKNTQELLEGLSLNTVCDQASCPNRSECYGASTATFMIMGNVCSRNCTFCNVQNGHPAPLDDDEPIRVAEAVSRLKLKHVVVTSVTRDDLTDGGAEHFADTVKYIKKQNPSVTIEVLIPDFQGDKDALITVINSAPHVINHNIETVPRLYTNVRPQAEYKRSLDLLKTVNEINPAIITKSGIMLGLGENKDEVLKVFTDLRKVCCKALTVGQYLPPSSDHHALIKYIEPAVFDEYKKIAMEMGFSHVASAPLVRSSYHAAEALLNL